MTTESKPPLRAAGSAGRRAVLGAAIVGAVVGGLVVVLGALAAGAPGAYGALVGAGLAVTVLAAGTLCVDVVARVLPGASMVVALLTYVLQVLALAVAFAALTGSGVLATTLDRRWLGMAVVAVALTWTVVSIRLVTRARIPVYDLPTPVSTGPVDAGARR